MRTSITPREDGRFDLFFHRDDGKFARTPMTIEELRLLHDNIVSILPDIAVPAKLRDAIEQIRSVYDSINAGTDIGQNDAKKQLID